LLILGALLLGALLLVRQAGRSIRAMDWERLLRGALPATSPRIDWADFLCFAIYFANLAYGRAYTPILEELGLTYPQYITIIAGWEENHQTVSSLGEKLFSNRATRGSNSTKPSFKGSPRPNARPARP